MKWFVIPTYRNFFFWAGVALSISVLIGWSGSPLWAGLFLAGAGYGLEILGRYQHNLAVAAQQAQLQSIKDMEHQDLVDSMLEDPDETIRKASFDEFMRRRKEA